MLKRSYGWLFAAGLLVFFPHAGHAQPDYPLRCNGAAGMASTEGRNLLIVFRKGDRPASQGLSSGHCSWLDRGLRPNEPDRIVDPRPSAGEAQRTAQYINAGYTWTFWVYNAGPFLRARASAKGAPAGKPHPID
jgi:hypothetical protein